MMSYLKAEEMKEKLNNKQYLQEKLYAKGFLITDDTVKPGIDYPFYGNWKSRRCHSYELHVHKEAVLTALEDDSAVFFIIGHAVDPFAKLADETSILKKLAAAYHNGLEAYTDALSDLTGVYVTGIILENEIYVSNDCTGMQIVYYGTVNGHHYFTSHSKLVADLKGLKQDPYIERLVNSRFYHYMGTWLPGDLSPFPEMHRLVPNHYVHYGVREDIVRFFPVNGIVENENPAAFQKTISWLSEVLHETLVLYGDKWPDKKVAISVTGGRDSTTTLACANGIYDKFSYFSYVSSEAERVDALAADKICSRLGLEHEIYDIPQTDEELADTETFASVLECNAGCIGKNNANDVRKRLFFIKNPKYDVEIKSWVNELGRGSQYDKYNKDSFPAKPTPAYCRALYKIILSPGLIHETDKVFATYLKKYYSDGILERNPWMELFWWEFCWSGGEGIFLTAEHRTSSEIAIPYNNRRYVERMLTVPVAQRKEDIIPMSIVHRMNPAIEETGVVVKNIKHTNKRAMLMRAYLEVFSRIHF